jgi:DNA-binding response OmpR family regulator
MAADKRNLLLLVEDSEDDAFLFQWSYDKSQSPFALHRVRNGAEAIDFLRAATNLDDLPRLIFLDLKMPIVNGFDVLVWLKKQTFPLQMPVVVISGSAQQEDKDMARYLGATDYLVKPVAIADIQRHLDLISSPLNQPMAEREPG